MTGAAAPRGPRLQSPALVPLSLLLPRAATDRYLTAIGRAALGR